MRAVQPTRSGFVDRDGVAIHYEVYGDGEPTVYLLMPDTIVESRGWKAQVPFLSRFFRVIVSDPRGNGRSGFPAEADGYADRVLIDDAWAVLDAVGADRAVLVGLCTGAGHVVFMASEAPGPRPRHLRDQPRTAAERSPRAQGRVRLRRTARVV